MLARVSKYRWILVVAALLSVLSLGSLGGCASSTPYEVSGLVLDGEGKGLAEVTLTFTGGSTGTATTDSTGHWEAAVKGRTTVTPSKPGYIFDPQSRLVTKAASNVDFTGSIDLEFYETTSMMPDSEKPNIAYVSEDRSTITFATASDYVRSLEPGDVIVSGPVPDAEYGLLQRVLSVTPDGLSVDTEDATFADILKTGVVEGSSTFTLEDMASEAISQGAKVSSDEGLKLTINQEIETGLTLSGSVTFVNDINLELFANYADGLYGFEFTTNLGMDASLALECAAAKVVEEEYVIYKFTGKPIWLHGILVLPVFKILVGVEGELSGQFDAEVSFDREIEAGFQYQRGQGVEPIYNIDGDGLVTEDPSISASASVKAYIGAKFELLVYGAAGPWVELDLYHKTEAELENILGEWDGRLKYDGGIGVDLAAGLTVNIFDIPGLTGELELGPFDLAYLPLVYGVSGIVKEANTGTRISGVEIQFERSDDASIEDSSVITNSRGYWSKFLYMPSERIVTPLKEGMIFEPRETRVSRGDNDVDFDAAYASEWLYSVSGRVTDPFGNEVSGVTISFSGGFGSVTTAIDGTWSKSDLEGSITVTPSRSDWIFSPSSINVSGYSSSVNFTGQNFTGGQNITLYLPGGVPLTMTLIPSGAFMMGSLESELHGESNERPQHQVIISQPFYMGLFEVTQEQWFAILGTNPSIFSGNPSNPVENVSWDACQTFIAELNTLGIGTFRLPTEAEWEYSCRAESTSRFYWGDDLDYTDIASYAWVTGDSTQPVGQKIPNAFGLFDISGNVNEWCSDWYGAYQPVSQTDPTGPSSGSEKILRGGCYCGTSCRSAHRIHFIKTGYSSDTGLRLVREL